MSFPHHQVKCLFCAPILEWSYVDLLHIQNYQKPLCSLLSNFQPLKSVIGSGLGKGGENIRPHKKSRFANNPHVRLKLIQQDESHLPIPALMSGVLTWEP